MRVRSRATDAASPARRERRARSSRLGMRSIRMEEADDEAEAQTTEEDGEAESKCTEMPVSRLRSSWLQTRARSISHPLRRRYGTKALQMSSTRVQ